MAALSADKPRVFTATINEITELPIDTNIKAYAGSFVGEVSSTGLYRALVAGDTFGGVAIEKCDNTGGAAAAKFIKLRPRGYLVMNVTNGSSAAVNGDAVYASDDNTLTTASTGNTQIGKIYRWVSGTQCVIYFEATSVRSI